MPYLSGILAAFAEPVLHGWANILDSYFSNDLFKRLTTLIFFAQATNLLFLPIVVLLDPPSLVAPALVPVVLVIALIEILYQYPYFWALRHADTSIVNSLFSLGKVCVPLFAFLIVGERISGIQYLGFFVIILSSVALTLDFRKLAFNKAFALMLAVSVILSLQSILFKYLFEHGTSWGTAVVWTALVEAAFAGMAVLVPQNLGDFAASAIRLRDIGWLFLFAQFLTWSGESAGNFALTIIPVSVVKGITSTQPAFVLLYALIFARSYPRLFKEALDRRELSRKGLFFALIILGTVLVAV